MSGLLNSSLNGSASNIPDSTGRSFSTSFSVPSGAASPGFHHGGTIQGLHNVRGSFNIPNMPGTLASRNSTLNNVPSGSVQRPSGNLSSGRFTSNNLHVALAQLSHGNSHGLSGVTNRGGISAVGNLGFSNNTNGGSIPGILPTSAGIGNRNAVPGQGISQILGNPTPRITSSVGYMVGTGDMVRTITSGGGISATGLASRLNFTVNSGPGSLTIQEQNRYLSGVLPQGSPQLISMLGNSRPNGGGPLSQIHVQTVNNLSSMGMLNDVNSNDGSPFDINNDFPQLTSHPSSAGGPQGQLGTLRKQGLGGSSIVQQNQEFSIQNEDFPELPGFKGGNVDYSMDLHQKEQLHDDTVSMMQSQHISMGRSAGFNLGATYSSYQAQQQQQQHTTSASNSGASFASLNNQDFLQGSDIFPSSHSTYYSQTSGTPGLGLRPLNSLSTISGIGSYNQQQYQQHHQHQTQSQFRQQFPAVNQSFRDQGIKTMQAAQSSADPFGLIGLLSVIRMSDPDLTSLALGIDLTTLGLNLNSAEDVYKTFGSPWSDEAVKGDSEFTLPQCYNAKQPPPLNQSYFLKFSVETLFYIFYSMPKDEIQIHAASELYNRGWFYHRDHRMWYIRVPNVEPLVKTNTYERGSYHCFDPNIFEIVRKDIVVHYEMVEKNPSLPTPPHH